MPYPIETDPRGCPQCAHGVGKHLIDCPNAVGTLTDAAEELRAARAVIKRISDIRRAVRCGAMHAGTGWAKVMQALDAHAEASK